MKFSLLILFIITASCHEKLNQDNYLLSSNFHELELIYKTVIEAELEKNEFIEVLDLSVNRTVLDLNDFKSFFGEKDKIILLEKSSFTDIKLFNTDSLLLFKNLIKKEEKKIRFEDFFSSYNSDYWLVDMNIPFFNNNKSKAIVELTLINPITEDFYTRFYVLEKKEDKYKIINTRKLDSNGTVVN